MTTSILAPVSFASLAHTYLRSLAPRARSRTLEVSEIDAALRVHAETVAANPGAAVKTRAVGGFVPNSYGYRADADRFEIETDAKGRTTYVASRAFAESRSFGRGDTLRTWTLTPGGAMKRAA